MPYVPIHSVTSHNCKVAAYLIINDHLLKLGLTAKEIRIEKTLS